MGWKLISKIETHMYDIKLRSWSQKCYTYRDLNIFYKIKNLDTKFGHQIPLLQTDVDPM
jgi:hypothetical protein